MTAYADFAGRYADDATKPMTTMRLDDDDWTTRRRDDTSRRYGSARLRPAGVWPAAVPPGQAGGS